MEERIFLSNFEVDVFLDNDKIKASIELGETLKSLEKKSLTYRFFVIRNGKVIFNSGRTDTPFFEYLIDKNGIYLIQGYVHHKNNFEFKKSNTLEYFTDDFKNKVDEFGNTPINYVQPLFCTERKSPFQDIIIHIAFNNLEIPNSIIKLGLREVAKIEHKTLGTIRMFSEKALVDDDSIVCFSGFVKSDEKILFGLDKTHMDCITNADYGCFTCATINKKEKTLHIFRDFCSYGKIYCYRGNNEYVISNRYSTLLRVLAKTNQNLSFDYEKTLLLLTTSNYVVSQNFTRQMDIKEIIQLTPESEIYIRENGESIESGTEISKILNNKYCIDYEQYDERIRKAAYEVKENVLCALNQFPNLQVDLTGGLDSRSVFAALTSSAIDPNRVLINTRGKKEDKDVKLGVQLNSFYGLNYVNNKYRAKKEESFVSDNYWRDVFLGTIYSGVGSSIISELTYKLTGGTGDAFGRPEYSRHYFNSIGEYSKDCLNLAKSIWQKQVVSSSIIKSDEINEIFIKRMAEELDKITGSSPLEKYDLVYFYYRNGYHFNPEPEYTHGTFVWMPLQSKQLFELYHATHDTFRNARLELDLIKAMNPLLMEIPFSSEKDDGDYTDNEYDLIGDRSLYLKNILHESKSTMEKWIEATDKRGYEIKNKVADHENNETIILSLMNKVKILFRINNGYYFKKAGYGLVYYVLSNLNSPGRIRVLYYKVSSIIDQVRLMKGDDGIDQYMLSINLLTNTPAKRELESLIETFSPEMDENKTLYPN